MRKEKVEAVTYRFFYIILLLGTLTPSQSRICRGIRLL